MIRGQVDGECRALGGLGIHLQKPPVPLHNTHDSGKPQPRPLLRIFGRKKWIKNPVKDFRRNPGSRITHTQDHVRAGLGILNEAGVGRIHFHTLRLQGQDTAMRHRVTGVDAQIQKNLM